MRRTARETRPNGWVLGASWVAVISLYLLGFQRLVSTEGWYMIVPSMPMLILYLAVIGLAILSPILLLLWASARWLRTRH